MSSHITRDALVREYQSAGSLLMRYADHQVAKSGSPEAIERLTRRKLRYATTVQVLLLAWTAVEFVFLTNYETIRERGWSSASDALTWTAFAAISCLWLQRTKRNLGEAAERLVGHLNAPSEAPPGLSN